jgi:TRAP transporter 4TM/12TM fusion protein
VAGLTAGLHRTLVVTLVLATSVLALYTGAAGPFEAPVQRGLFLLCLLPLSFLLVPSRLTTTDRAETALGLALAGASILVMAWVLAHAGRLFAELFLDEIDVWIGLAGLVLILEAVRRTIGAGVAVGLVLVIEFAWLGDRIPIEALRHGGLDAASVVSLVFYSTDGVFGTPVGVVATFVALIIMLGALLSASGGADLFMNVSTRLAGRFTGGPAKIAVTASALMGMITGATVANIATTGPVTIPMMKRAGYDARFAGAVEALASSGGQLMPPVMGAAAFIMIDYLDIGYGELMLRAIVPAVLFFLAVLMVVHVRSARLGVLPIPPDRIPVLADEVRRRGHMVAPIVVLVTLLGLRFGIMYAAFYAVVSAAVVAALRRETRLSPDGLYAAMREAMEALCPLIAICAGAGILIGVLTATGMSLKITSLIDHLAGGSLLLTLLLTMVACIVLGMGLPTVAAYVVLATLVPASLISLGVPAVAAHLFIFYFAILSAITPPVCTGAYVAAGIARADPMRTGVEAFRLGLVALLLPFAFVYEPSLLLLGDPLDALLHIVTCAAGIVCWAYGLEGWFRGPLGVGTRAALIAAGMMLIWPLWWVSVAGAGLGGAVLAARRSWRERPA